MCSIYCLDKWSKPCLPLREPIMQPSARENGCGTRVPTNAIALAYCRYVSASEANLVCVRRAINKAACIHFKLMQIQSRKASYVVRATCLSLFSS